MKWAVIENAGYDGEKVVSVAFDSYIAADAFMHNHYDEDEIEELHVDIAHWDDKEGFWSYDH